jgi:hypothetical protein
LTSPLSAQLLDISFFSLSTLVDAGKAFLLLIQITELQSSATPFSLRVTYRLLSDLRYANEHRSTHSRIAPAPDRDAQDVEAKFLSRTRLLRYFD